MAAAGWVWFTVVAVLVLAVSATDWRQRLVANEAVVALTVLAAGFVAFGASDREALVSNRWATVALAVGLFAVGIGIHAAGLIGAGDVKLLLPVALIMARLDTEAWLWYLGAVILVGGATLVVHSRSRGRDLGGEMSIPMAPVLALGVIPALLFMPPTSLFR